MSIATQDRVREIAEQVQGGQYEVDPAVVAQAIVGRLVWDDVPDLTPPSTGEPRRRQPPRLRGLVRVRRLIAGPMPPTAFSAR
jgi:Anti-sigma-28 factor, FlgM